jgi:hypothetical protein
LPVDSRLVKKRLTCLGFVLAFALVAGCNGPQSQVVTGVVLTVDQPSAGNVDGFTLRLCDGQVLTFTVGVVDQDEGAFPPEHLTEHQRTAEPAKITYKVQNGQNVATKLQDADEGFSCGPGGSGSAAPASAGSGSAAPAPAASGSAAPVPTGSTPPAMSTISAPSPSN